MKLFCNAIISGKFYPAGEDIPTELLPEHLKQYEAQPGSEAEELWPTVRGNGEYVPAFYRTPPEADVAAQLMEELPPEVREVIESTNPQVFVSPIPPTSEQAERLRSPTLSVTRREEPTAPAEGNIGGREKPAADKQYYVREANRFRKLKPGGKAKGKRLYLRAEKSNPPRFSRMPTEDHE